MTQAIYRQYQLEVTVDDLPLLGEPFAVELANTRYLTDHDDLDFLADADAIASWFGHAEAAADIVVPGRISAGTAAAIRRVRNATRQILTRPAGSPAEAEVLHREARRAGTHVALDVSSDGAPTWCLHHEGPAEDVLVAATASRSILFLGGDDIGRVRNCAHPACPMLFVQRHRARRFCSEPCAHSLRQARYYRSARASAHGRTP